MKGILAGIAASLVVAACGAPAGGPVAGGQRQDISLAPVGESVEHKVPRDATFETLLRPHLPPATTVALLNAITTVFNPKNLRANQQYRITRTLDGLLHEFRYQIDPDRLLRVVRRAGGNASPQPVAAAAAPAFTAEVITLPKVLELDAVQGEIGQGQSLVGVLEAAGEAGGASLQLALEMANIFGGEVDFNSDLQPGDRFEVLVERATRYGEFAGYGEIKAAVFENDGRKLTAVRAVGSDGRPAWYDSDGRSLKRQFLKSPLPFDPRVTSGFSYRRRHPVHGTYRPHLGVDYGAAAGTPVQAVANGVVDFAGHSGEAGRMVRIRHAGGYQTAYLHLSSFASGIRPGARVNQGQIIGKVGSSGTATGPHLDYRIQKNGTYVNPLAELRKMPKGEPIAPAELPAFVALRDQMFGELSTRLAAAAKAPAIQK